MTSPRTTSRPRLEGLEAREVPAFVNPVSTAGDHTLMADVNGDGRADLIALDDANSRVSVRLGNGNGTFQAVRWSNTGKGPRNVKAGDFNGDGRLDLLTINSGNMSVLIGRGDGGFQAPRNITLPRLSNGTSQLVGYSPAVGDLNRDGKLDIVVTGHETASSHGVLSKSITHLNVFLGRGDGTFQTTAPRSIYSAPGRYKITYAPWGYMGDFNADGKQDVLFGSTNPQVAHLLLGNGDGTLGTAQRVDALASHRLVVGDLDGDGDSDVVRAKLYGSAVSVSLSNGDGTFAAAVDHAVGVGLVSVELADLNRDGRLDIVAASPTEANTDGVSVLLGLAGGAFSPAQTVAGIPADFLSATLADFDGDGWVDLALNRTDGLTAIYFNDRLW